MMSENINASIAEALEPKPQGDEYSSAKSKRRLHVWSGSYRPGQMWIARDFDTDPTAMVALIDAMRNWDEELGLLWIAHGRVGFGYAYIFVEWDRDKMTIMRAIRDAAAKALGVDVPASY